MHVTHDQHLRDRLVEHALTGGRYGGMLRTGIVVALIGLVLFVVALGGPGHDRAWQAFHVNWIFFTGLAGGSVALTAVYKIANAKWAGLISRFAQASIAFLPVSLLGLGLIFTVGYEPIYGHMAEQLHSLQHGKAVWLSHEFMAIRLAVAVGLILAIGWALIRADMVPDMFFARGRADVRRRAMYEAWTAGFDGSDAARDAQHGRINRLAGIFIPVYAIGFTIIAFDTIMALQPHWFSNLLGGWYFMGSFLGAHTLLALMMLYGENLIGIRELISPKQRHDLGKMIFGFTVFWTYLMWAQFLVIWYGNLPEETGFVFSRLWGPWRPIGAAVGIGMFLVPFWGLIGARPKKMRLTLGLFASISLLALWLERYLLVLPSITAEHGPPFGMPEVGATLLLGGLFILCYSLFARTFPMVSPRLAEITLDREVHHVVAEAEFGHDESAADYVSETTIEREKHHH
jgi:hypothetical protein